MATRILREWVIAEPFADLAALKALDTTTLQNSVIARVFGFGLFEFSSASVATGDDLNVVDPTTGPGRWLRITPSYLYVNSSQKVLLQYIATADGQAGGTTLVGGNGASENLLLSSTTSATKGYTRLGANGLFVNETNGNNNVSVGSLLTSFAGTHVMFSTPREGTQYDANFLASYAGNNDAAPSMIYAKSRGTIASPTIVQTNDELGLLDFLGYDGTNYRQAAQIFGLAGNTITPGSVVSGRLEFDTADATGAMQEVMNLDASKNTNIFGAFRPNNDAGTSGYVLTSQGAGTYPVWSAAPPPSGTAGGDLTGTYPNPTIATNAVTYAKFQQPAAGNVFLGVSGGIANYTGINVTANSLVGRGTSSNLGNITLGAGGSLAFGSSTLFRAALTGDVTASADSNTTTLANTAVTPGSYTNTNLTVDSKGRITAASNGSAGSFGNLKTVGSGGDYATFAAAFTALQYNLLQISNVTETADFTFSAVTANIYIYNPCNYLTNCGAYSPFRFDNVSDINIVLSRWRATFNYGAAKGLFQTLDTSLVEVRAENCEISNGSATPGAAIVAGANGTVQWYSQAGYYYLGNADTTGFTVFYINSLQDFFYGASSSCGEWMQSYSGSIVGATIQGAFDADVNNWDIATTNVSDVKFELSSDFVIYANRCNITNINTIASGNAITISGTNVNLSNSRLNAGIINLTFGRINVSNTQIGSITDGSGYAGQFTNVQIVTTAQTLVDNNYDFSNVYFPTASTTLTIQGDYGSFRGLRVGVSGSSGTIVINASANKTILAESFATTITDNGTGTQLIGNLTY